MLRVTMCNKGEYGILPITIIMQPTISIGDINLFMCLLTHFREMRCWAPNSFLHACKRCHLLGHAIDHRLE